MGGGLEQQFDCNLVSPVSPQKPSAGKDCGNVDQQLQIELTAHVPCLGTGGAADRCPRRDLEAERTKLSACVVANCHQSEAITAACTWFVLA